MTALTYEWENPLVAMAQQAVGCRLGHAERNLTDEQALSDAYAHCATVTSTNSRSFYLASALLPAEKRRAVRALYAFCRTADDIVDDAQGEDPLVDLLAWRARTVCGAPLGDDPVAIAWHDTCVRYHVPRTLVEQLLDGVARDVDQSRYQTFAELAEYAYGVASTVGLMSMHIVGFQSSAAIPYAVRLGVALQLTNILRDIADDWRRGRVYLPQEELAAFGLSDADIAAGVVSERWRRFMRFQIERNRRLYREAWPGIGMLQREGRLPIAAAASFYAAILQDIENHDYDVFSRRAYVGRWGKLRRVPGLWLRTRLTRSFQRQPASFA